jgi:GNAT superfamily N-acetyltransferase
MSDVSLAAAREEDVPVILGLIKGLGEYEKLSQEIVATEADLRAALFGPQPAAEVVMAWAARRANDSTPDSSVPTSREFREAVGFALFFHNYSTFVGRRGLYLEDLFVVPEWRGRGVGHRLLQRLARIAVERGCGRMEWSVLDWNEDAIGFYRRTGARIMDDWRLCRLTGEALDRLAASSEASAALKGRHHEETE